MGPGGCGSVVVFCPRSGEERHVPELWRVHYGKLRTPFRVPAVLPQKRRRPETSPHRLRWRFTFLRDELAGLAPKCGQGADGYAARQYADRVGTKLGVRELDHRGAREGHAVSH